MRAVVAAGLRRLAAVRSVTRRERVPGPRPAAWPAVPAAALAAATFLAGLPWLRDFRVGAAALLLAVASAAPVAIAVVGVEVRRRRPEATIAASLIGLVVLLLAVGGRDPAGVWRGLTSVPSRLITETLPLAGAPSALAAPLVLTWLCGASAAELVLRSGAAASSRGGRAGAGAALAVPIAAFVVAHAVSAAVGGRDVLDASLLLFSVTVAAVSVHTRARARGSLAGGSVAAGTPAPDGDARPHPWRPWAGGLGSAAAAMAALTAVMSAVPALSTKPASLSHPARLISGSLTDPVDVLGALRDRGRGARPLLAQVDTSRPSDGYLAMAVLDHYDGAVWSFDATFEPTGGRVPSPPAGSLDAASVLDATTVTQRITPESALDVPLLPALERPVRVSGPAVAADAATGMLMPEAQTGVARSYTVQSEGPLSTLATVTPADALLPAGAGVPSRDVALPASIVSDVKIAERFLATLTGETPTPTVSFLRAAMTALRTDERRVDPALAPLASSPQTTVRRSPPTTAVRKPPVAPSKKKPAQKKGAKPAPRPTTTTTAAPPSTVPPPSVTASDVGGTTLSKVIEAVTVARAATPEQFATFFALAARALGVPTRLVAGLRIAGTSSGGPVPAGEYRLDNSHAWAWVEVPVAGIGWVVADPTPDVATGAAQLPPESVRTSPTTVPRPNTNAAPRLSTAGHAVAARTHVPFPGPPVPAWLVAVLAVAALVSLAGALGPGQAAVRRGWRRRARRSSEPAALAVGAWLELLDGLGRGGMPVDPAATSSEVAAEAGRYFGDDVTAAVRHVGEVAERAVFAPGRPPDRESAEAAWEAQRALSRRVHRELDRRGRARALVVVGGGPRRPSERARRR